MANKTCSSWYFFLIVFLVSVNAFCQEVPTPSEFIAKQKAIASKFLCVTAKIKSEAYKSYDGVFEEKADSEYAYITRWKPGYVYFSKIQDRFSALEIANGAPSAYIELYSTCPEQCRYLGSNMGIIQRGSFPETSFIPDPYNMALGKMPLRYIDTILIEKATIRLDGEDKIVLEGTDDVDDYLVVVDKNYGYMPILIEQKTKKGKLVHQLIFEDYRKVGDDLWLSFTYTHYLAFGKADKDQRLDGYKEIETVLEISVNQPLSDDDFKIAFPKGTYVDDRILNTKYVEGERITKGRNFVFFMMCGAILFGMIVFFFVVLRRRKIAQSF